MEIILYAYIAIGFFLLTISAKNVSGGSIPHKLCVMLFIVFAWPHAAYSGFRKAGGWNQMKRSWDAEAKRAKKK